MNDNVKITLAIITVVFAVVSSVFISMAIGFKKFGGR